MADRNDDILRRVMQLSDGQRSLLELRLDASRQQVRESGSQIAHSGTQGLTAFVVPVSGSALTAAELRSRLADELPDYMVPSSFVFLSELPKNVHGKVDRHSLEDRSTTSPVEPDAVEPTAAESPLSEPEEILIDVWREVLGQESIGIHDNFFELGGDSLLSIRILANARQRGLQITPEDFVRCQTISEQACAASFIPSEETEPSDPDGTGVRVDGAGPLLDLNEEEMDQVYRLLDEADRPDEPS